MIESVKLAMLEAENLQLRKLLWLNHGCNITALYGDDGEMQCGACAVDFKRWSMSAMLAAWRSKARVLPAEVGTESLRQLINAAAGTIDHLEWRKREFPGDAQAGSRGGDAVIITPADLKANHAGHYHRGWTPVNTTDLQDTVAALESAEARVAELEERNVRRQVALDAREVRIMELWGALTRLVESCTHHRCFNESRLVTTNREVGLARAVLAAKHPERSVERTVVAEVKP